VGARLYIQDNGAKEICPNFISTAIISGSICGLIILIGLLTFLFYKCYIVIDDNRQFARYQKEEEMLRYATNHNANTMYKSPISTYRNPMYGKATN
jgi:hypothetical protein